MKFEKKYLPAFFLLILIFSVVKKGWSESSVRIVEDNKSSAIIIVPTEASPQLQRAAKELQTYIRKTSGALISIEDPGDPAPDREAVSIILQCQNDAEGPVHKQGSLYQDEYRISFPDNTTILISGKTEWGVVFGVYEFLERYIGIRWLFPGPKGDFVPEVTTIDIPKTEVYGDPAFFSRQFSSPELWGGQLDNSIAIWAHRNRMHGTVQFHHNLYRLFPPEKYTQTHPEFFPLRKHIPFKKGRRFFLKGLPWISGERYLPASNAVKSRWQPCFSAPGIVDEAVNTICEFFKANPQVSSYSLGVNDSGGHCECNQCLEKITGEKNYFGSLDRSDLYYGWANAVAAEVLEKYPDKWFGCLAYSQVAQPPANTKLHPRIIPFVTYDRMKWVDAGQEATGKKISELWAQKAENIGWYEYLYGTPYMLPRVYFHQMAENFRYAHENGVRAMYAEAYPNWGEGPKYYITLKLWWNPYLDVDVLLDEWYTLAVGKRSAVHLSKYYQLWEDFWTRRVPTGEWFSRGGQYLRFTKPGYLDLVTFEDIETSRKLLEAAVRDATTDNQRQRAQLILRAFEYYEASALSYLGLVKGMTQPGRSIEYYRQMNQKRYDLVKEFQDDPFLSHPLRFDRYDRLEWGMGSRG